MRESQQRQGEQVEEGGHAVNQGVQEVQDDEEECGGQSAQGQLVDKGIGTARDVEEIMGETLRPSSNISSDLDFNQQPACFPVGSKNDSNLIHVKPAKVTSAKDI